MTLETLLEIQEKENYTLIGAKEDEIYTSTAHGIRPIMMKIKNNPLYFQGYTMCDKIVGKAAAMLFVRSQIAYLYAHTLSEAGKAILDQYQIPYSYHELAKVIINRDGTDMCPMEKTVLNIDNLDAAYEALDRKVKELMQQA